MNGSSALANLPEALLPPGFVDGVPGSAELGSVLLEQRRGECLAFCRTVSAVYALFRDRYGERESAFLSSDPIGGADFYAVRRELSAAYEAVKAEISVALRIGPAATETAIEQAVGFVERLPRVFALIGQSVLSPRGGMEALSRARALTGAQALEFDERVAELLTEDPLSVVSVPALREAADRLVHDIDPVAAERRRRMAEEDRRVTVRPAEDGMAVAYALLTAHEGRELEVRVDGIAASVCDADPRTAAQRRADGLMMLVRGFVTLGCWCVGDGCPMREARPAGDPGPDDEGMRVLVRYRTLIHVVVNEKTLADPDDTGAGYLIGHGPVTAQHARDLAAREDAVLRPFGVELPDTDGPSPADVDGDCEGGPTPTDAHSAEQRTNGGRGAPAADAHLAPDADGDSVDDLAQSRGSAGSGPRSAWFRATGVDVARPAPKGVLLAARCCHAGTPVIDVDVDVDAAPAVSRCTAELASTSVAEARPSEHDSDPADAESSAAAQGRALPTVIPHAATLGADPLGTVNLDAATTDAASPQAAAPSAQAPSPRALVIAQGSSGYRFSADLTRYLTLVYPRCVFPLCTRPASRCQIDHAREYDHGDPARGGATAADNGQPLCVPHHQLKTAGVWTDARTPDGRILWIGPAGQRVVVDPTRAIRALFPDLSRVAWTIPADARTRKTPKPSGPTRLQREHQRRERLRAAHVRALEWERKSVSVVDHRLEAVLAGRDPAHHPPPDEPPPF